VGVNQEEAASEMMMSMITGNEVVHNHIVMDDIRRDVSKGE
jgi:4-hydroxy-3-methylbut-2-enyl diphosphate reductase IspH